MQQRYHTLVPVVSDQLGLRRPDRDPSHSVVLLAGSLSSWIATCRGGTAAATTKDIDRVGLARALDLAPERDGGYDLMDHLPGDEPPESHWP